MTAARDDLANLPYWPLGLSREQAAVYVGVSVTLFEREIAAEIPCLMIGARKIWHRRALERWLDARAFGAHESIDDAIGRLDGAGHSRGRR